VAEAVAAYREAIRLKPDFRMAHCNACAALAAQGKRAEAVAASREAIRLLPDFPEAHYDLGTGLAAQGKWAEAVAAFKEAIRLKPDYPEAHNNLGAALLGQGKLAEAVAASREALRLKHENHMAHTNLGFALYRQGRHAEGAAALREALRLKPDSPEAHFYLGASLAGQGRLHEALDSLRKGHELGRRLPGLTARTAFIRRVEERLAELDRDLPAFLGGQRQPSGPEEQLELASLCGHPAKRLYAAATGFYAAAFTARPDLGDDLGLGHRYKAACCAALAGCGRGEDKPGPNAEDRARLRRQALGWLRADLEAWAALAQKAAPQARQEVRLTLARWRRDVALAGVRGADALAKLPEAEREG
jgi:tetratricopeptide (TPR) repeat protein